MYYEKEKGSYLLNFRYHAKGISIKWQQQFLHHNF